MTNSIEVIYFPKLCPHCKVFLRHVRKMHAEWLECHNMDCPYLVEGDKSIVVQLLRVAEPFPYTYAYRRR